MDNQQWTTLIKELKDAINDAKDSQVRFTSNNTAYNKTINDGFTLIKDTIHDIDDLIGQLTALIDGLQKQIGEFEAKQSADQTPRLTAEIAELQKQLSDAQETQRDAVAAMQDSIAALNTNNELMKTSTKDQDVAGLNKTIMATTTSLEDIKTRLQLLLNETPSMDQQNNPLPDDTEFELPDSNETITYGDLKRLVNNKIKQITDKYGKEQVPNYLTKIYNTINAVNAKKEGIQTAIYKMPFDANGQLQGGKRKRKFTKKQRKMRRNNTKKRYRHALSQRRTKYKKSKKRSIARL
jgi:archaellum component FlaC